MDARQPQGGSLVGALYLTHSWYGLSLASARHMSCHCWSLITYSWAYQDDAPGPFNLVLFDQIRICNLV